jgi:hypothetical protein
MISVLVVATKRNRWALLRTLELRRPKNWIKVMSLSKLIKALLLVLPLVTAQMAAQSDPAGHADQNALSAVQELPSGVATQTAPAKRPPLVHFKNAVIYDSDGLYADSVAIGDLNGDGKPDLVVISACHAAAAPTVTA